MTLTRREILGVGGGFAVLTLSPLAAWTGDIVDIVMKGRDDGSHVWFDPIGVLIEPGQTVRWTNLNPGNSHTTTAYSPENFGRPLRMPKEARPWASDYLLPNETFSVSYAEQGVYDYFCIPHEHAGMVGRIIVGGPAKNGWTQLDEANGDLPEEALKAFPTVEEIMAKGIVLRA